MKKLSLFLTVFFITGMLLSIQSFAAESPIRVEVNGTRIIFPDAQPFFDSQGRTQTPARFIGEALGATVSWDGNAQKVTFEKGSDKLIVYIGKKGYELNGQTKQMDTAAITKDTRTYVPVRYIAEAFGATVKWDNATKTVYIETSKEPVINGETEVIGGFVVPHNVNLSVFKPDDTRGEIKFIIDLISIISVEKQIMDLADILSQKCAKSTVDEVVSYIKQKKTRRDYLAEKFIFDNKSQRYIWIKESREADISIMYLTREISN